MLTTVLEYSSCSIILFLLRAIIQLIFFTPKAPPFDPTRNQPYVGAIFASNIFCVIYHYFFIHSEASEATRGYLHGGLFIDFIGQKAPVPLIRFLSLDLLIMFIDFVMLGLVLERVKTVESTKSHTAASPSPSTSPTRQDHDSEERGVLRQDDDDDGQRTASSCSGQETDSDIDLDEPSHNAHTHAHAHAHAHAHTQYANTDEHTELLADPTETEHGNRSNHTKLIHPLDEFSSGQFMLMDIGLLDIIRDQWQYSPSSPSSFSPRRTTSTTNSSNTPTSRYVPSPETAAFLRERFGLQVSADGRVERVTQ